MTVCKLQLDAIRIDGGTQPRVALSQQAVAEYAEAMTEGVALPPVRVYHDGSDYWLADGFHRFFAHKSLGALSIDAEVVAGSQREAVLFSVGANASHGLRRSNDDKRRAVLTLLQDPEWGAWSDREIARRCSVGHPLVASLRSSLTGRNSSEQRTYATKHGTVATMDTSQVSESNRTRMRPADGNDAVTPPEESSAGQAGGPDSTGDHAEPDSKPQEAPASAPELAELRELLAEQTAMLEEAQAEIESLVKLVDAGDQMAEARRQIHHLQAEVRVLRERQVGLMNEAAEAKRLARAWRMKLERIEKAGA